MTVYQYGNRIPKIGKNTYISDSARVIGDVEIQDNCYIGHGAIIRGDYGTIHIGRGTAVEEGAILHIRPDGLLELEDHVTVGHGAIIHGRLIRTHAVIGIGAVIGFDVVVGAWAIVAEGSVIPQKPGYRMKKSPVASHTGSSEMFSSGTRISGPMGNNYMWILPVNTPAN